MAGDTARREQAIKAKKRKECIAALTKVGAGREGARFVVLLQQARAGDHSDSGIGRFMSIFGNLSRRVAGISAALGLLRN